MPVHQPAERPSSKVVLVSNHPKHLEMDTKTLKELRLSLVQTFSSGADAFAYLAGTKADMVICDTRMDDMDGLSFLRLMSKSPDLKDTPVVLCTEVNDKNAVLDAIGAGCAGYILRPYNRDTFERHTIIAQQLVRFSEIEMQQLEDAKRMLESGNYEDAIEEFEEIVAMRDEARKYYDLGCQYLVRQKYGKAIVSFNKAIKINDLFAEAYQGLAEAHKGKGDLDQYKFYLTRSAEVYAEFDKMEKVKELFIEILKHDTRAPNPFNTLGVKLRKQGDYDGALNAYTQALELTPHDENIHFNMAKALYFMSRKEEASEKCAIALSMNPDFTEARKLYRQIKGKDWSGPRGEGAGAATGGAMKDI